MTRVYRQIRWSSQVAKPGGSPTNGTEGPVQPTETVVLPIQLELELTPPPVLPKR